MESKLRIATYGACHASALREMLLSSPLAEQQLSARYTRGCHEIPEHEFHELCADLKNYDILIYQPITAHHRGEQFATARLLENVRPDARVLSFQYFHFELYTPFMLDSFGSLTAPPFSYLDYHLAIMIARDLPQDEIVDRLNNENCVTPYVDQIQSFSFSNLREREARVLPGEKELDIKICDFVEKNYSAQRLSYTYNHPTKAVLNFVLAEVAQRHQPMRTLIGSLPDGGIDPLAAIQFPVPKYIKKAFDLTFEGADGYVIDGNSISAEDYVRLSRDHYRKEGEESIRSAIELISKSRPWYRALLSI